MDVFTAISPTRYFYAGMTGVVLLIDIIQLIFLAAQHGLGSKSAIYLDQGLSLSLSKCIALLR
jgi:hypothetical protein